MEDRPTNDPRSDPEFWYERGIIYAFPGRIAEQWPSAELDEKVFQIGNFCQECNDLLKPTRELPSLEGYAMCHQNVKSDFSNQQSLYKASCVFVNADPIVLWNPILQLTCSRDYKGLRLSVLAPKAKVIGPSAQSFRQFSGNKTRSLYSSAVKQHRKVLYIIHVCRRSPVSI